MRRLEPVMGHSYEEELRLAIRAVRDGFALASAAQSGLTGPDRAVKADASPVSVADFAVQAVVNHTLAEGFGYPIMAEESAGRLRVDPPLLERVGELASPFRGELRDSGALVDAVDLGGHPGGSGTFWVLDPIDGTAGFVAGRSWAVALALVDAGRPVVGVLACARMPGGDAIFHASSGSSAVRETIAGQPGPAKVSAECKYAICESYEAGHAARVAETRLSAMFPDRPTLRMDGQGKYACVAAGHAAAYVRLSRRRGRLQCAWDHAAGTAVVEGAGGTVTDATGLPLDFSAGRSLPGDGILATNGDVHGRALEALEGWRG